MRTTNVGRHIAIVSFSLVLLGGERLSPAGDGAKTAAPKKLALLVGCTLYQHMDSIPELYGPANDVPNRLRLCLSKADANSFASVSATARLYLPILYFDTPTATR